MAKNKTNVSIIDIANEIGVSKATVGHVLSGKAEIRRVGKGTAQRVRDAAKRMGYQPNYMARSLRNQKSGLVSMIFNDLELNWADTILKGAEGVFRDSDYGAFIAVDRKDLEVFRKEVSSVVQRRDEGVIFHSYVNDPNEYSLLIENNIPVIFIGDIPENLEDVNQICTIMWDDVPGINSLVEHLSQVGAKTIAFIGCHHGVVSDSRRYRTYTQAIDALDIETRPHWTQFLPSTPLNVQEAESNIRELLGEIFKSGELWPDALFALNDTLAITVIEILREMGIRCPEDILITGIGDIPIARYSGITTISEPLQLMGKIAAETVLEQIKKPELTPANKIVRHNKLNIRRSTQR